MMAFVFQTSWSPLLIASCNGHLDIVKTLIEAGANVNQANKVGCTHILVSYNNAVIVYVYMYYDSMQCRLCILITLV